MKHIVALSGGWDSTAMALKLAEKEPRDYEYICTPTGLELPDMDNHWAKLEGMLGKPLTKISAEQSFPGLVVAQKSLPNWRMRWCTRMLKIEPFEGYVLEHIPCTLYIGIRADEFMDRSGVDWEKHIGVTRDYPLTRWGWGVQAVVEYVRCRDAVPPERTDCDCCFFQTLWEWYQFWLKYPERWMQREALEDYTGHTLRSDSRDTWPASMKGLRARFEAGDVPKKRETMKDRKAMCSTCAR